MLGISVAKVKHSIGRLVRQGRLKESAKKHDMLLGSKGLVRKALMVSSPISAGQDHLSQA
nr:hypothetical protein [Clostridia bacterium]